ncbi:MAG TPA: sulfatase/phosphatase domain-containing protein, partial [Thermomicrobiales bacterium]|nr:sulfatase/phosphatase domain-containing protein [Thermomicrobiales bacterium]
AVGQHGLMGKQNLYEHSQRIPLVMAGPGIPGGQTGEGPVWHGDTTATIRHLCGIAADPDAEGAPLIGPDGTVTAPRATHGAAYEHTQRSFREGRYKLIAYRPAPVGMTRPGSTPGVAMTQLFDLETDPWEMRNLADDQGYREIRARLEAGLQAWQLAVGDPLPGFLDT